MILVIFALVCLAVLMAVTGIFVMPEDMVTYLLVGIPALALAIILYGYDKYWSNK